MCSVDIDPRSQIPPKEYTDAFRDAAQPIAVEPIGYVESPYKERFGTPRQPVVTKLTAGGRQEGAIVITRKDMLPHALPREAGASARGLSLLEPQVQSLRAAQQLDRGDIRHEVDHAERRARRD